MNAFVCQVNTLYAPKAYYVPVFCLLFVSCMLPALDMGYLIQRMKPYSDRILGAAAYHSDWLLATVGFGQFVIEWS
ncbi:MAG: hypothetical protein CMJ79_01275 [Planctomycetaceae bacterium]|nr:hypothetical protein [Planctomycetaceae bacterium]|tara:strand:- start:895 stop:1122 length:228 start_codon:yes stop_codon:yes gene_type:complete